VKLPKKKDKSNLIYAFSDHLQPRRGSKGTPTLFPSAIPETGRTGGERRSRKALAKQLHGKTIPTQCEQTDLSLVTLRRYRKPTQVAEKGKTNPESRTRQMGEIVCPAPLRCSSRDRPGISSLHPNSQLLSRLS